MHQDKKLQILFSFNSIAVELYFGNDDIKMVSYIKLEEKYLIHQKASVSKSK